MGKAVHCTTSGGGYYIPIQQVKKLRLGVVKYLLKQVSRVEPGLCPVCGRLEPTAHDGPLCLRPAF